jgi:Tfp pilus assembly protein PilW
MLATVRNNRGFSGLELLLGLSLLIVVVGVAYEFLLVGQRAALKTRDSFMSQGQLRAGIDNMTDEIRWADSVTAASATSVTVHIPQNTPFSVSSPYSVTFAYNAAAQALTRQQDAGPAAAVAYNIVKPDATPGLSVDYYDASSTWLTQTPTDLTAIARIRMTVIATSNQTSRTLVGDASLRSR